MAGDHSEDPHGGLPGAGGLQHVAWAAASCQAAAVRTTMGICRMQEGEQHASHEGWRLHLQAGSSILCAGGW